MSWATGAITGELNLDHVSFDHGLNESFSHAETFGGRVREVMQSVSESFGEVTGLTKFSGELSNLAAGFAEGGALGSLHAASSILGMVRENAVEVGNRFHEMGEAAERAGVSVEFLSGLAPLAQESGMGLDQLGLTFKFLQKNAADAADGNKDAAQRFAELGFSVDFVKGHLDDTQGLFLATIDRIKQIGDASEKTKVLGELFGDRTGDQLRSIVAGGSAGISDFAAKMRAAGEVIDQNSVKLGNDFVRSMTLASAAWTGFEDKMGVATLPTLTHWLQEAPGMFDAIKTTINGLEGLGAFKWLEDDLKIAGELKDALNWVIINSGLADAVGRASAVKDLGYDPYDRNSQYAGPEIHYRHPDHPASAAQPAATQPTVQTGPITITVDPHKIAASTTKQLLPHVKKAVNESAKVGNANTGGVSQLNESRTPGGGG